MTHRVAVVPDGPSFVVAEGERILDAARRAGVWLPFECGWGSCSTCKVTLVEGEVELLFPEAPAVNPRDERRRRILTCQCTPRSDVVIRPLRHDSRPDPIRPTRDVVSEVIDRVELGPGIFRLLVDTGEPVLFRPGQYAIVEVGGVRRCYSMANLPGETSVEFVFKRYAGPASTALAELPVGASLPLSIPYGDMWLRPGDRPLLLVAGGTGIAPIIGLVRQLVALGDRRAVSVVYGANTVADLVLADEVANLVGKLVQGSFYPVLASPPPNWDGASGVVTDVLSAAVTSLGQLPVVYLAGPPPMVGPTLSGLGAMGVQLDQIYYDSFG